MLRADDREKLDAAKADIQSINTFLSEFGFAAVELPEADEGELANIRHIIAKAAE